MTGKGRIIGVRCPGCGDPMSRRYTEDESSWTCRDCVFVYCDAYFDTFRHFEHLVTRARMTRKQILESMDGTE